MNDTPLDFTPAEETRGDFCLESHRTKESIVSINSGLMDPMETKLSTNWVLSHRADARALPLADRHYNRQKIGSSQFLPPGRCFALITPAADALWATSFPFARYVHHAWAGAWMNCLFRNENRDAHQSSDLIREAVAITRWYHSANPKWSCEPEPALGMVTFVDADKTKHKRDPGRCYRKAGFKHVGFTKAGLWAFQLLPAEMPQPLPLSASADAHSSRAFGNHVIGQHPARGGR